MSFAILPNVTKLRLYCFSRQNDLDKVEITIQTKVVQCQTLHMKTIGMLVERIATEIVYDEVCTGEL